MTAAQACKNDRVKRGLILDLIILMRDIYINPPCTCTQWPILRVSDAGIPVWVPTLSAQIDEKLIHKTSAISSNIKHSCV